MIHKHSLFNNNYTEVMIEILQNKNSSTRFQILVEIASSGPDIQQKSIALKLGVTPQAISDYIHQLLVDELIISTGRSHYKVSTKGVDWMLKILREIKEYSSLVEQAVTNITIFAAMAENDIKKGQTVGLKMKNGILFATLDTTVGATGIAVSGVRAGEDLDVSHIQGLVQLIRGKITILQVPVVQKGGSRQVNIKLLKDHVADIQNIGAIGIESLAALKRLGIEPRYLYGVIEAAIEAVQCGLPFIIICTDDAVYSVLKKFKEEDINYELIDLRVHKNSV
jgi:putative transcriptional regulator